MGSNAAESDAEGFSVTRLGDQAFSTNYIGVRLPIGKIYVGLMEASARSDISGAGIYEGRLSKDELLQAQQIHQSLCKAAKESPKNELSMIEPAELFSVDCMEEGRIENRQGKTYELSRKLALLIDDFYERAEKTYLKDGRIISKIDATVEKLTREGNSFSVSVKFINNGLFPIKVDSPAQWNKNFYHLNISAKRLSSDDIWAMDLTGLIPSNAGKLAWQERTSPDGDVIKYMTIPSRSSMTLDFIVTPNKKITKGTYDLSASINMYANVVGSANMGRVNFHSDWSNPTRTTFDRDYPSTPQEWKDFEARKAKEVSFLMPGATVAESGYYRAASIAGTRDQFVRKFEQGTAAPDLDFQRWDRWEWEADLARATVCKPGETCPREGRWILRAKDYSYGSKGDLTYPQHQQLFRMGEQSRSIDVANVDGSRLFWEWLSA